MTNNQCDHCNTVMPRTILELQHTGDPYGSGFEATESNDGGKTWFYRGDIGAMPRAWWRTYARRNNYTLREAR
jgi:hypothetical protein